MRSRIFPELLLHERFVVGTVADIHLRKGVTFEDDGADADSIEVPAVAAERLFLKGSFTTEDTEITEKNSLKTSVDSVFSAVNARFLNVIQT